MVVDNNRDRSGLWRFGANNRRRQADWSSADDGGIGVVFPGSGSVVCGDKQPAGKVLDKADKTGIGINKPKALSDGEENGVFDKREKEFIDCFLTQCDIIFSFIKN